MILKQLRISIIQWPVDLLTFDIEWVMVVDIVKVLGHKIRDASNFIGTATVPNKDGIVHHAGDIGWSRNHYASKCLVTDS